MSDPSIMGDQNDQDPDNFRERFATVGPFRAPKTYSPQQSVLKYAPGDITRKHPHIARGTYGVVFKGNVKGIANEVVIKDMEILDQISVDEWQREIQIMARTKSQYVAEVFGYSNESTILTIIMELMENGDLFGILHKNPEKHPLSLIQRMRMSRHCCLGLKVLHDNKIIHRDIKSMNILVNYDYVCKLTDFGCSKLVSTTSAYMQTAHQGTPLWMAPEVKSGNYGMSSDVYSIGLVLYEIFEKKLPNFDPETKITTVPKQFGSAPVVLPCIKKNPDERPKIDAVISLIGNLIRRIITSIKNRLPEELLQKICRNLADESKDVDEEEFFALYSYLVNLPTKEADEIINGALQKPSQANNNNNQQQQPQQQSPQTANQQNQPLRKSASGPINNNKVSQPNNNNATPQQQVNNNQQQQQGSQVSPTQVNNNPQQNNVANNGNPTQQQPQGFQRPSGQKSAQPQPQPLLRPSGRGQNVNTGGQPQPQLLRPSANRGGGPIQNNPQPQQQPQQQQQVDQAVVDEQADFEEQQRKLEEEQREIEEKQRKLEEQKRQLEERQARVSPLPQGHMRPTPNSNPNVNNPNANNSPRVNPSPNPNAPNNAGQVNRPSNAGRPGSMPAQTQNNNQQQNQQNVQQQQNQQNVNQQQVSPQGNNNPQNPQGNPQGGQPQRISGRGQPIKVVKVVQQGGPGYQQRQPMGGPNGNQNRNRMASGGDVNNNVINNNNNEQAVPITRTGSGPLEPTNNNVGSEQQQQQNGALVPNSSGQPLRDNMGRRRSRSCGPSPTTPHQAKDETNVNDNNNQQNNVNNNNPNNNPNGNQIPLQRGSFVKKVVVGPNGVQQSVVVPVGPNGQVLQRVNSPANLMAGGQGRGNVITQSSPNIQGLNLNQGNGQVNNQGNNTPSNGGPVSPRGQSIGQGQKVIVQQRVSKVNLTGGQPVNQQGGQPRQIIVGRPNSGREQDHNAIIHEGRPNSGRDMRDVVNSDGANNSPRNI